MIVATLKDAIEYAVSSEKAAVEIYSFLHDLVTDQNSKKFFRHMQKQEENHIERVRLFGEELSTENESLLGISLEDLDFTPLPALMLGEKTVLSEAIKYAKASEKSAFSFYDGLAARVKDAGSDMAYAFFSKLAEVEKKHYDELTKLEKHVYHK